MSESPEGFASPNGTHVLVAHPSEMVRCGLISMLQSLESVGSVNECSDLDVAEYWLETSTVDVLVLPCADDDGEKRLAAAGRQQRTKVLALLEGSEDQHLSAASEIRADGFILTSELTAHALGDALSRLLDGGMPLPTSLARRLLDRLNTRTRQRSNHTYLFTPREHQTLRLLAQGMTNKEVAKHLGISQHGAKRHVANVIAKLNCPNRTLAVALALREGVIEEMPG